MKYGVLSTLVCALLMLGTSGRVLAQGEEATGSDQAAAAEAPADAQPEAEATEAPETGEGGESPKVTEASETTDAEPPAAEAVTETSDEMGEVSPGLMRELRRGFPEGLSFFGVQLMGPRGAGPQEPTNLPIAPFYELGAGGEILITAWGSCATRPA